MDHQTKSILKSHGYDAEHFRDKYVEKGSSTGFTSTCSRFKSTSTCKVEEVDDDIYICKSCQGLRTVKEEYNHIVLEKNCVECDGEGVMWFDKSKGQLLPLGQRDQK